LDDFIDEEEPEIPAPAESKTNTATSNQSNHLSTQDYEMMKKELFKLPWYWPKLSRIESQKLLSNQKNGSFLIRDSSEPDSFTLSFRTNSKTFHCRNQW
jgi:SH2 domain